jgi:hypothetical protein
MIGGYQAGQISLDDLASGFRNRTWAAITRDWGRKTGPARGAADDFEPVIAGRFDDVVHAYDHSASTSIGYAVLAQPPPAPADETRASKPRWNPPGTRPRPPPEDRCAGRTSRSGVIGRAGRAACLEWLRVDLRPDASPYPSAR